MTAEKRPTMRELVETMSDNLATVLRDHTKESAQPQPPEREPVAEADALRDCIRALDTVTQRERNRASYSTTEVPNQFAIERVLRHLAARYGVPLVERQTEPCSRAHVDSLDSYALQQAIQAAAQGGVR